MMKKALFIFITSILLFSGCELFEASAFPEYFARIIAEHDYAERIQDLFDEDSSVGLRYQLFSLLHSDHISNAQFAGGEAQHMYFLITPPSGRPGILLLNETGEFLHKITLNETFTRKNSFSLPFIVSNNKLNNADPDDVLAGTVSLSLSLNPPKDISDPETQEKVNHDLEGGYAVAIADGINNGTYIFGPPDGGSAINGYFTLRIIAFDNQDDWGKYDNEGRNSLHPDVENVHGRHIDIVPAPAILPARGYALSGLIQTFTDEGIGDGAILLFTDLTENKLHLWHLDNSQIRDYQSGGTRTTRFSIQELNENSSRATIDLENTDLISYTSQYIIVHRTTGTLERFDLNGRPLDTVRTEKRVGILFAFSSDSRYMYRFDPESKKLQVMKTWWQP